MNDADEDEVASAHTYHEDRPWGSFDQFAHNELCTVKILTVKADAVLSLQSHKKRDEFWRVVIGAGTVRIGDDAIPCKVGDEFVIPRGTLHRIEGGDEELQILEISRGEFDENDIVRVEDAYGRV